MCQACAVALPDGAAYCPTCGTRVAGPDEPTLDAPQAISISEWYPDSPMDREQGSSPQPIPPEQPAPASAPHATPQWARSALENPTTPLPIDPPWHAQAPARAAESMARDSRPVLMMLGLALLVVVALALVMVKMLDGASSATPAQPSIPAVTGTATSPVTVAPSDPPTPAPPTTSRAVAAPAGARHCAPATGAYAGVYVNGTTSCPFAQAVFAAYAGAHPTPVDQTKVTARSPVTKKNYDLVCAGTTLVTCTGGNNAVIYLTVN
ncbi:MAG: hypothetical protein ACK5MP_01175 [Nostocoides sp.]